MVIFSKDVTVFYNIISRSISLCHLFPGGYSDDSDYIVALWSILREFNDAQRRKFLKFVTSCSRPPLLGFKVSTKPPIMFVIMIINFIHLLEQSN